MPIPLEKIIFLKNFPFPLKKQLFPIEFFYFLLVKLPFPLEKMYFCFRKNCLLKAQHLKFNQRFFSKMTWVSGRFTWVSLIPPIPLFDAPGSILTAKGWGQMQNVSSGTRIRVFEIQIALYMPAILGAEKTPVKAFSYGLGTKYS